MKWYDVYKFYKEKYSDYIILYKIGNFYNVIDNDITIMKNIFNYKIVNIQGIDKVGFPTSSLNGVMNTLDRLKINYLVLVKESGIVKVNYKRKFIKNSYISYSLKSKEYCNKKLRIDNIYNKMIKRMEDELLDNILDRVESIINEG